VGCRLMGVTITAPVAGTTSWIGWEHERAPLLLVWSVRCEDHHLSAPLVDAGIHSPALSAMRSGRNGYGPAIVTVMSGPGWQRCRICWRLHEMPYPELYRDSSGMPRDVCIGACAEQAGYGAGATPGACAICGHETRFIRSYPGVRLVECTNPLCDSNHPAGLHADDTSPWRGALTEHPTPEQAEREAHPPHTPPPLSPPGEGGPP
jgi:hypothetical protein